MLHFPVQRALGFSRVFVFFALLRRSYHAHSCARLCVCVLHWEWLEGETERAKSQLCFLLFGETWPVQFLKLLKQQLYFVRSRGQRTGEKERLGVQEEWHSKRYTDQEKNK